MGKAFYNTKELLRMFGVSSRVTLINWREQYGFPEPIVPGRYCVKEVDAWLESRREMAKSA